MVRQVVLCLLFLQLISSAVGQSFTPGNIVVWRVGDGTVIFTAANRSSAYPVFLDEYTPGGVLVQSVAMPTIASGANNILTMGVPGLSRCFGMLEQSTDGQYLLLAGVNAPVGTLSVTSSSSTVWKRVIGLVKYDGAINTSTALTDFSSGDAAYGALSTNGVDIWCFGGGTLNQTYSPRYTTVGSATSVRLSTDFAFVNSLKISAGQLYFSQDPAVSSFSIAALGTGLPTTSGTTAANLPGFPNSPNTILPFQFVFVDLNPNIPGPDVLYFAAFGPSVSSVNSIYKYSFNGNIWVSNGSTGSVSGGYVGITASVSGTDVMLFATRKGSNNSSFGGGELVKLTDASGHNGTLSGTPVVIASVTTPDAKVFRGVALAPGCVMPSGSSISISNVTTTNADISWAPLIHSIRYEYAVTSSSIPPPSGTATSSTNYQATGLSPASQYYFHLRNVCSNNGSFSSWATVPFSTLAPVCNAPVPASTNINGTTATVKWPAITGATEYQYAVTTSNTPPDSGTLITDTTLNATGLSVSTTYYFHARTKCGNAFSGWSTISFTTTCPQPPVAVISVSGLNAVISWPPASGVTIYQYAITTSSTPPFSGTDTSAISLSVSNLTGATTYYLHVRSSCGAGVYSSWRTAVFATGCLKPVPFLISNNNAGYAILAWNKVSGAREYEYAITNHVTPPAVGSWATTTDTILQLRDLQPGLKYFLHIRSHCNEKDLSDWAILEFHPGGVELFPNPARDIVTVRVYGSNGDGWIAVYDATGRLYKKIRLTGNTVQFNTSAFAGGVYLVKYESLKGYVTKLLKQ